MPLDTDSLEVLEKVKRGTPARFVVITKGIKLVSLVVYRKGSLDSAKRKAKESGNGEISFGVVEGQGANLSFKLAKADGFEKPPTPDLSLKAFLNESKFDCKPTIEIIEALPDIPMDDGTGQAPPNYPPPPIPQRQPQPTPPRQPPPEPPPRRPVYRSRDQWETVLAQISSAPDVPTRNQLLAHAVSDLKQERTQAENDKFLTGDPNARLEVQGIHTMVADELKALAVRPQAP